MEALEITRLSKEDFILYTKITSIDLQYNEKLELIKIGTDKILDSDIVWPNLRALIKTLKVQIEAIEERIAEKTLLLQHKIRHKTDKKILLKILKSRKVLEEKRDRAFDYQLKCESVLGLLHVLINIKKSSYSYYATYRINMNKQWL